MTITDHHLHGFDVSHFQPAAPDFTAGGRVFAICKASEGTGVVDAHLAANRAKAHTQRLVAFGMYHFARPGKNSAAAEADHFLAVVGRRQPGEFAVLDYEVAPWNEAWAVEWIHRVQAAGWPVVFYSYRAMITANAYDKIKATGAALWVASYSSKDPIIAGWLWTFWQHCVDTETEILTADGWRTHDALEVGDEVLTINRETGLSEWQPVDAVSRFPYSGPMVALEGQKATQDLPPGAKFSALTTPNHRWWLLGDGPLTLRLADDFSGGERVPLAAPCMDVATDAKYADALVELVAWYWTEGSATMHRGKPEGAYVSQSHVKHPEYCARIRSCLISLFGSAVARNRPGTASWVESRGANGITKFRMSKAAAAVIHEIAPQRRVSLDFVRALTKAQLHLFVETSIDGDGWRRPTSTAISQKDPEMLLGIEVACALLGIATTSVGVACPESWVARYGWRPAPSTRMQLLRRTEATPTRVADVHYDGVVWCPTTANHTWLARRHGSVYFTGNTDGQSSVAGNDGPWDCSVFHTNNLDDLAAFAGGTTNPGDDMTPDQAAALDRIDKRTANVQTFLEQHYIEKIVQWTEAHAADPSTGNGAGTVDPAKLADELKSKLADEIAKRLAS